jgi:hypothetical protein
VGRLLSQPRRRTAAEAALRGFAPDHTAPGLLQHNATLGFTYDPATALFGDAVSGARYRFEDGAYREV